MSRYVRVDYVLLLLYHYYTAQHLLLAVISCGLILNEDGALATEKIPFACLNSVSS